MFSVAKHITKSIKKYLSNKQIWFQIALSQNMVKITYLQNGIFDIYTQTVVNNYNDTLKLMTVFLLIYWK